MVRVLEKYGDYPKMFSLVFDNAKSASNKPVNITWEAFDVVHEQAYPQDLAKFDAIVITGSSASAYEDVPWIVKLVDFVKSVLVQQKPKMLGICFGHQIIARAAGGVVAKNSNGWERLNQVHQDQVSVLPAGFHSLATTAPHTPIHALISDNGQCLTIQGHPEFNRDTVRILLGLRAEAGVIAKDFAQEQINKLDQEGPDMEDVWLVQHFLDFLLGDLVLQDTEDSVTADTGNPHGPNIKIGND
ncbi:class I glutamine amidotransferase-like protein [Hesseltinella vesiculosa]|uniref:Class I glutamine amidotransferase-like protein n=1 Tax=Hesseltinella vesiculosa TaxID=101127 RepID=A0A1X2GI21_9FUNG|nr:class I glutamine amidotransferase-like protein [Hesseltinella vesiculosa]